MFKSYIMNFLDTKVTNISLLSQICKYGIFYYPANKHYDNKGSVVCDICNANNLDSCIGYETYDACLECVNYHTKYNIEPVKPSPTIHKVPPCCVPMNTRDLIMQYINDDYKHLDYNAKHSVYKDVFERLNSQKITQGYLDNWRAKRGLTQMFRIPEDPSYAIIDKMFNNLVI